MRRKSDIVAENEKLRAICRELQWMARRYADGSKTYVAHTVNACTKTMIELGVKPHCLSDGIIWARDGHGRGCDGLTEAQATGGTPEAKGEI